MAEKNNDGGGAYSDERNTEPSKQTGNINFRNNNVEATTPGAAVPDVENANNEGIGDSALNDKKLTNFTQNHSADA
ncbi:MAG: hypothetical protein JWR72_3559 [Flavisolibacter sp.]|jgi:hypothetical protein|nr:hypothetical protein [Flavisolibacter sp.]